MSNFPILDLVIGIIFIYFLLSIISSSVVEMILTITSARAQLLQEWLCSIFSKPVMHEGKNVTLGEAIMNHCITTALSDPGKSPSYIDAKNFASALIEKITFNPDDPKSIATDLNVFINRIEQTGILSPELQRVFLTYAYEAKDSYAAISNKTVSAVDIFRSKIEEWYNSSMERLGGNLKRRYARPFTFWIAVITVVLLNADSISLSKYLYSNPDARASIVAQAFKAGQDSLAVFNSDTANIIFKTPLPQVLQNTLDSLSKAKAALEDDIPLGWDTAYFKSLHGANGILSILLKIVGLIATIFAIMLGAPFWFDLLNKTVNLRGTGNKPIATSSSNTPSSPT